MEDKRQRASCSKHKKSNKRLDLLTSTVIHDLCNQFTMLGANVDLLIDNCDKILNESTIDTIDYVRDQIATLLHSFLGYLRDSSLIGYEPFSTDEQINRLIKILNFKNRVNIKVDSDKNIYLKKVIRAEYNSLVLNLLSNAIDAVSSIEDPQISIHSFIDNDKYTIEIRDNGIGLPKYYNKVFKAFYTTKGNKGTGLGLFNSKMIVKKYNGIIKASRLKVGSLFYIGIPL